MDTNRQKVLQCIKDLFLERRPVHRVLIAQYLNMKLSAVDEAVKRLKEDCLIRPTTPGYVEPVEQFPPDEAISRTTLPNGRTKIEKGDQIMELTPHEVQVLGKMLHGDAMAMATWQEERRSADVIARLEAMVRAQGKELSDMKRRLAWTPGSSPTCSPTPKKPAAAPTRWHNPGATPCPTSTNMTAAPPKSSAGPSSPKA